MEQPTREAQRVLNAILNLTGEELAWVNRKLNELGDDGPDEGGVREPIRSGPPLGSGGIALSIPEPETLAD